MATQKNDSKKTIKTVLGIAAGLCAVGLVFVAWVYPTIPTASYAFSTLLVIFLGALVWINQRSLRDALRTRSVKYGTNAAVTVGLVVAILIVVNYLNANHFIREDLTKNKLHSLSDQTIKVLKDLKQDLKFTIFVKTAERDPVKSTVENYLYHTKKIAVEYVDPDRDPSRTKAANVKKYNTIIINSGSRETRIEEVNEEKLTNGILKVLKDKPIMVCFLTGHGEKNPDGADPDSYSQVKNELLQQNYQTKTLNLLEEATVSTDCSVVMVLGPNKSFFDKEIAVLRQWLDNGGRMFVAIDPDMRGNAQTNKELKELLGEWFVEVKTNLVLDPRSKLLGASASVPLVGMYSKEHPITREFQAAALFPMASTLDLKPNTPSALKTWWLAKSMPGSFAKNDFKAIATGKVALGVKDDVPGPHIMMVAIEGKRSQAADPGAKQGNARIIALGTSGLASNRWAGHGANLDLMLNSISWLADDESMISIRPKEEGTELPTLTEVEANYIGFLVKFATPGTTLLAGFLVWRRRRRL